MLYRNGTFKKERDLSAHIANNLRLLEPGLTQLWIKDKDGIEFVLEETGSAGSPRCDILALDCKGGIVAIECKIEVAQAVVVGQVSSYVAKLRERFGNVKIRAFIVCFSASRYVWYAIREVPNIEITVFGYNGLDQVRPLYSPLAPFQPALPL